jgi:uncharacterized repeat protein (TIGR04138 family)
MQEVNFDEAIEQILAKDARYHRDAYAFLRDALDHTQKLIARQARGQMRHVNGPELMHGVREYALQQFGPMTTTVFEEWGVNATDDFGAIVFNMIEIGLLAKTEKDQPADFSAVYDFDEAFRRPFQPASKRAAAKPEAKPASA